MVQILLVDAAAAEAALLGEALRSGSTGDRPIEVIAVADPREAVAVASRQGCDVVVADLDLPRPGWSGPYVLRRVRELCPQVRSFLIADTDAWAPLVAGAADGLIAREPQNPSGSGSLAERLIEVLQTLPPPRRRGGQDSETWRQPASRRVLESPPPDSDRGEEPTDEQPAQARPPRGSGVGDVIAGKYRLQSELGHGGMGIVYRAADTFIGREVAVKLLKFPAFVGGDAVRERMRREVMITGRLAHPNLVTVHDAGIDRGEIYIVLELIEGLSLRDLLHQRSRLPAEEAILLTLQILDALEHIHGQGIVHRDLKPANILVNRDGRVKVVDFGIAKLLSLATGAGAAPQLAANMTMTGSILGTPAYMAPEQLTGEEIDARTDLYALGAVFFEMIDGRALSALFSPFAAGPRGPLPLLAENRPLTELAERALARSPDERFASATEMRNALAAVTILAAGERDRPAARRPWWQLGKGR